MSDTAPRGDRRDGKEPPGSKPVPAARAAVPDSLVWPPPSEEVDEIEIVDLGAPGAAASSSPLPPQSFGLSDVVQLDARSGSAPYVLDLRTAPVPQVAPRPGNPPATPGPEPAPLTPPAPRRPRPSRVPPINWPPSADDADAITVVDMERPDGAWGAEAKVAGPGWLSGASHAPPDSVAPHRARLAPVLGWSMAAVLVVGVAGGSYRFFCGNPVPAEGPASLQQDLPVGPLPAGPAVTPDAAPVLSAGPVPATDESTPESGAAADSLEGGSFRLETAQVAWRAGNRERALQLAVQELTSNRAGGASTDLVARILKEAQAGAATAHRAAQARVVEADTRPAFRTAASLEDAGMNAWRAGSYESAFRFFTQAADGFARVRATPADTLAAGVEALPAATPAAESPAPPAPVAAATVTSPSPPPPASVPAPSPPPLPVGEPSAPPASAEPASVPAAAASRPAVPSPAPPPDETLAVRRILTAYQTAYTRLDARAAVSVYPVLDVRALTRAFGDLQSQRVDFERCDIDAGPTSARASCVGRTAFVRKVGSQTPVVEPRRWAFDLQKGNGGWRITGAKISRP